MSRTSWRWAAAGVAAAALCGAASSEGAGFAIFEQGARGMGFAGAYTAQSSDGSAIFHNAAGIAFLKDRQFYVGATGVKPSSGFTGAEPFPGSSVTEDGDAGILFPPSIYYTHPFSERLAFGLGVHTPFGLRTQWANPDTYTGRFISTKADLKNFSFNPTVAYKLADRFAVGGGLDIRFSKISLERHAPVVNPFTFAVVDGADVTLESDYNTGFGFNLGVLAKPDDTLSIGLSYRHKVKIDYTGNAHLDPLPTGNAELDARVRASLPTGDLPISTSIEFPAIASVGLAKTFGDWTIEADVNWYQWKTFDQLEINFETQPQLSETIDEGYENSFQYRFGVERVLNETWAIRGGYFFDESPSPPSSMSPLLPDANRNGFCLGGSYKSGSFRLDAATWYVHASDRSTNGTSKDHYEGTYDSHALTLGISLGYTF